MAEVNNNEKEQDMAEKLKVTPEWIRERAEEIDPDQFLSWMDYGWIYDSYDQGWEVEGRDNYGKVWWVTDAENGRPVTARDFLQSHPNATWGEIYAHKEQSNEASNDA
jgi:hypothetical protein